MPKAHLLTAPTADLPLSVAAVSLRLGISPSTLRTWERRYGVGIGDRRAGTHRRYLPDDVARLARMVELIHAGVPTAEAAAIVQADACNAATEVPHEVDAPASYRDIVEAAQSGKPERLILLLESAIATDGLVRTWSRLIEPALDAIRASDEGEEPGHAPSALLTLAVLRVLTEVSDTRPLASGGGPEVLVLADEEHSLAAHVMGVALQWHGLATTIMATGTYGGSTGRQRVASHLARHPASLAVVAGRGATCADLIGALTAEHGLDIVLVGADTPAVLDARVVRVRTLAAAVEEALALVDSPDHEVDG